jgi:cytoskeletal protein RodZ
MSATARKDEVFPVTLPTSPGHYPDDPEADLLEAEVLEADLLAAGALPETDETIGAIGNKSGTEYATRGAKGLRSGRPHLRMVSPLRPERASRGLFALVVVGMLIVGMIAILVINTSLAQGAFTVSELQGQQAVLAQQEQALSRTVAAAGAPNALEKAARAMGMVPSQTPVFIKVPSGKVLGQPKAAPGGTAAEPQLLTPADATAAEAVDNASVGTDLPVAPGADYDPAAADAAAAQAKAASEAAQSAPLLITPGAAPANRLTTDGGVPLPADAPAAKAKETKSSDAEPPARRPGAKKAKPSGEVWSDSTVIDVTVPVAKNDAGLTAVPVP